MKTYSTPERIETLHEIPCVLCGGKTFKQKYSCGSFFYVECCTCTLVQMNPQPSIEEVHARYKALHGKEYYKYELENEDNFLDLQLKALHDCSFFSDYKAEKKNAFNNCDNNIRVLDVGCATGALLDFLKIKGFDVQGVEISPSKDHARARGLEIHGKPFEQCGFASDFFDVILASHFIEHLNNPGLFLREVRRVLKPGGRVYLTTPNAGGFQARLTGKNWRMAIFDHLYLFSKKTIKAMLKAEGFVPQGIFTWGGLAAGTAPLPIKRTADKLAKVLGAGDVMIARAQKFPSSL